MAVIIVHEAQGGTREQYEQVTERLSGGKGDLRSRGDWPAPGLLSHAAGPDVPLRVGREGVLGVGSATGPARADLHIAICFVKSASYLCAPR